MAGDRGGDAAVWSMPRPQGHLSHSCAWTKRPGPQSDPFPGCGERHEEYTMQTTDCPPPGEGTAAISQAVSASTRSGRRPEQYLPPGCNVAQPWRALRPCCPFQPAESPAELLQRGLRAVDRTRTSDLLLPSPVLSSG